MVDYFLMYKTILVTGCAGFIGFLIFAEDYLKNGNHVIGVDNINDYYDVRLKEKRLEILNEIQLQNNKWEFFKNDLTNKESLLKIFENYSPML